MSQFWHDLKTLLKRLVSKATGSVSGAGLR